MFRTLPNYPCEVSKCPAITGKQPLPDTPKAECEACILRERKW
jgi:hypothetical protein